MNELARSALRAVAAGATLGAIALVARYAPSLSAVRARLPHAPAPARDARHLPPAALALPATLARALTLSLTRSPSPAQPPDPFATPASRAACPADMTLVEGEFCPDLELRCLRKGTGHGCAEYARGVACHGRPDPRRYCIDRYEWPNQVGANPLVYVDWHEAKALCAGAKKRLCRRSEWMLACEGPKRLPYPWGFVRQPSPCNVDRGAISFDVGALIKDATREEELARLWQADKIGTHPDCVSAYGAFDMSGNVDEWTDDQLDDPRSEHPSTLNGGYWGPVRDTCRLTTTSHGPTFKFYQVGFRCCDDPHDGVAFPPPRPWIEPERAKKKKADGEDRPG
ncbi:MAG TPA: SUMF1/EgtB/PvdO family nonheme iron enzyme [Minicystis sp.]|nr:SUMF1/EgtB/PvdO family nonheme iron enzyme [Minicystis sp.]